MQVGSTKNRRKRGSIRSTVRGEADGIVAPGLGGTGEVTGLGEAHLRIVAKGPCCRNVCELVYRRSLGDGQNLRRYLVSLMPLGRNEIEATDRSIRATRFNSNRVIFGAGTLEGVDGLVLADACN